MQIANPIYDVVFKYLMEDSRIARLVISTIIGEEIMELEFLPREKTHKLQQRSLTVYRLDFMAKIRTGEGYKQIIIEIQKAKFPTDIMRFRRYLGEQYSSENNTYRAAVKGLERKKALPLLSIYFLGHKLDHTRAPVIKVLRRYYDATTGEELKEKEEFIESLTHDSFIIQIPALRKKYQTEMETLLNVFNQSHITENHHILNIREEDYPEKYRPLIRRLQKAIAEPEVMETMDIEDEVLEELQDLERALERKDKALEQKDKALERKDKALEQKDKALEQKDKALEQKDKALEEQKQLIEELKRKLE